MVDKLSEREIIKKIQNITPKRGVKERIWRNIQKELKEISK